MNSQQFKKIKLPNKPGVYFFKKGNTILYIGKATSLRDRVKSYFGKDIIETRGPHILDMVVQATSIKCQETDSVLEALILEANLIKKYQPKYNTKEKDNKSFNYVCITDEEIPKVMVIRGRNIFSQQYANSPRFTIKGSDTTKNSHIVSKNYKNIFGPFPNGSQLKEAMRIVRRIFPYFDEQSIKRNNKEFYKQLGLIPVTSPPLLTKEGNEGRFLINSPLPNPLLSKAGEIKNKIFALEHINDVSLIKTENILPKNNFAFRIEAYDVAHMTGQNMVGVMTVIENNEPVKSEYKKFIIRTQNKSNDTGALEEILSRRLRHTEWGVPTLLVLDGSTAQINVAQSVIDRYQFKIPIVSVVKDDRHKAKAIIGDEKIIKQYKKDILLANSESHRFAITFHKQRRNKNFLS